MSFARAVLVLVTAAILTSAITVLLFQMNAERLPANAELLPYTFSVGERNGIDAGTDIFRLGMLQPGNSAYRSLTVSNVLLQGESQDVRLIARGKGSEWITITPQNGSVPLTAKIQVDVPLDAPYGVYEGNIIVIPFSG
jgi:hypothetical protein